MRDTFNNEYVPEPQNYYGDFSDVFDTLDAEDKATLKRIVLSHSVTTATRAMCEASWLGQYLSEYWSNNFKAIISQDESKNQSFMGYVDNMNPREKKSFYEACGKVWQSVGLAGTMLSGTDLKIACSADLGIYG